MHRLGSEDGSQQNLWMPNNGIVRKKTVTTEAEDIALQPMDPYGLEPSNAVEAKRA